MLMTIGFIHEAVIKIRNEAHGTPSDSGLNNITLSKPKADIGAIAPNIDSSLMARSRCLRHGPDIGD